MPAQTKILLIGTGAVGGYYGGRLAQGGAEVSLVCRRDYEVVKKQGIFLESILGDFLFKPKAVYKTVSEYQGYPDYLLVATKVLPEIKIIDLIKEKVGPKTSIVLLQNGINIEAEIAQAFPNQEIISGLAFICATRLSFGKISHQDYGRLTIGKYPTGLSSQVKKLQEIFAQAKVQCQIAEDIIQARWIKLVWNAPFNPISVLGGGVNTKDILSSKENFSLVKKIMQEVYLLAEKDQHPFPPEIIEKNLTDTLQMKPYKTSMLIDFESKRPLEVEAILGNAVRIAQKFSLPVPYLESLYALLKLADEKNRS